MNARAFDLGTCPRVRARQARATRAVLRACALLPERWSVELPPLGSATMTFAGYDSDPDRIDAAELAVSFGAGRGRVSVESSFAARLVDTVLGGGAVFSTARSIGPAGRGVLVGVLAPVFDRIGGSLQLGPVAPREGRDRELASVLFRLETVVASGWLRLTPPAGDLLPRIDGADTWRARAGRIPVTGSVEIAATGVPAGALAGVAVGDAVVFDGVRAATFAANAFVELPASRRRSCRGRHRRRRREDFDRRGILTAARRGGENERFWFEHGRNDGAGRGVD